MKQQILILFIGVICRYIVNIEWLHQNAVPNVVPRKIVIINNYKTKG